jgi:hypothetical protein
MNFIKSIFNLLKSKKEVTDINKETETKSDMSNDIVVKEVVRVDQNLHLQQKINTLYSRQREIFDTMDRVNKLQICIPTGAGKNYLMMVDLLRRINKNQRNIFAISTHRLMLNTQHLNDIFKNLSNDLGSIGFIFVGSSSYDVSRFKEDKILNSTLRDLNLSYNEIILSTINKKELNESVEKHFSQNRQVVILTTYHSLDKLSDLEIDTIYCDEAHTLASVDDECNFKKNFESCNFKNSFFFTATPKDVFNNMSDGTSVFLMNNKHIFGERVGLSFRESVELGYIVKPVIHIALPSEWDNTVNLKSTINMVKFIEETYIAHGKFVEESTYDKSKIAPKILVKCPSVDEMWDIHKNLIGKIPGVIVCAGASRGPISGGEVHQIDSEGIRDRNEFLNRLQSFGDSEKVIVLHFDILSEGINIPGFTGVEFLSGKLPTIVKTLQNTGRATRLHNVDRERLSKEEINTSDLTNWIKPYCGVIIPYWDLLSQQTTTELANTLRELRDKYDFNPSYYVSIGSDLGRSESVIELDNLNKKDKRNKSFEVIEQIQHEIEKLDNLEIEIRDNSIRDGMNLEEWFKYANDL